MGKEKRVGSESIIIQCFVAHFLSLRVLKAAKRDERHTVRRRGWNDTLCVTSIIFLLHRQSGTMCAHPSLLYAWMWFPQGSRTVSRIRREKKMLSILWAFGFLWVRIEWLMFDQKKHRISFVLCFWSQKREPGVKDSPAVWFSKREKQMLCWSSQFSRCWHNRKNSMGKKEGDSDREQAARELSIGSIAFGPWIPPELRIHPQSLSSNDNISRSRFLTDAES